MCIIKEPWDTPQRATPKSCYPCPKQKNLKNSRKSKTYQKTTEKKQSTHSKANSKKKTQKK
jgi:hypothetical protein